MKYVIFIIVLAVLKDSHPLNPEILKYDQYMKDFEETGRRMKQEAKDDKMDGLILKRQSYSGGVNVKNIGHNVDEFEELKNQSPWGNGWVTGLKKKLPAKCDTLHAGLRESYHEGENGLFVDVLYPAEYRMLKREDRYKMCILALALQTGDLADNIYKALGEMGYTVGNFCRSCENEIFKEFSHILHEKIQMRENNLTLEVFEKLAKQNPDLKQWLSSTPGREAFITTILKLRETKLSESSSIGIRPETDYKCLLLPNVPFYPFTKNSNRKQTSPSAFFNRKLQVSTVKQYFQSTKTFVDAHVKKVCETEKSAKLNEPRGDVLLEFDSVYVLRDAVKYSRDSIGGDEIFPEILNCKALRDNECTVKSSDTWWEPS